MTLLTRMAVSLPAPTGSVADTIALAQQAEAFREGGAEIYKKV